jgi:GAF domain-containing protein
VNSIVHLQAIVKQQDPNLDERLTQVCMTILQIMPHANRVSLWQFSPQLDAILCLKSYDEIDATISSGLRLARCDFPHYFATLLNEDLLVAANAREHHATRDFHDAYFIPYHIHSLLDCIVYKDGKPIGIICCESAGKRATWAEQELQDIKKIAAVILTVFPLNNAN